MKAVTLMSGGKDSFLATLIAQDRGFEVVRSISILPEEESMMFHVPNIRLSESVADLIGLDTEFIEEDDFDSIFDSLADEGVEAVISGAIASDYQETRIERLCTGAGLLSVTPIWRLDPYIVLNELILRGVGVCIISVSAEGMDKSYLGRKFDPDFIDELRELNNRFGIHPCGEGGEYETIVESYNGKKSVDINNARLHWEGSSGYLELLP